MIVSELQKKVKMLQQRHRRHLEKLVGLENTVSQLRQNSLLNEERLQLLERVMGLNYLQTEYIISPRQKNRFRIKCENEKRIFCCHLSGIHADQCSHGRCR